MGRCGRTQNRRNSTDNQSSGENYRNLESKSDFSELSQSPLLSKIVFQNPLKGIGHLEEYRTSEGQRKLPFQKREFANHCSEYRLSVSKEKLKNVLIKNIKDLRGINRFSKGIFRIDFLTVGDHSKHPQAKRETDSEKLRGVGGDLTKTGCLFPSITVYPLFSKILNFFLPKESLRLFDCKIFRRIFIHRNRAISQTHAIILSSSNKKFP